jgi:transposase, IS5 family
MRVVDELLEDEKLLDTVYEAQGKRHGRSRVRGRQQTPAEVALRMLILNHLRNWSYETLERKVRANVVYRSFCRIGMEKVPDGETVVRLGQVIGVDTIAELRIESWLWRKSGESFKGERCGWIRRWWRPMFTIRPAVGC